MAATRTPVAVAALPSTVPAPRILVAGTASLFRGIPQAAACKPLQLGVSVFLSETLKSRQQLLAVRGPKGGWKAAGKNRPIGIARWHVSPLPVA
jgi:hypothetical protein